MHLDNMNQIEHWRVRSREAVAPRPCSSKTMAYIIQRNTFMDPPLLVGGTTRQEQAICPRNLADKFLEIDEGEKLVGLSRGRFQFNHQPSHVVVLKHQQHVCVEERCAYKSGI
uniref:Uncharacterized protein n=1 Tax=Trieres chinensis TaxID=1514140 RepID=A0A7S2EPT7_TRICV|mmetsp:Transcript_34023/g.69473  ORF Transcript_34023/g.69473 Transcript_34023/m.69473 type:complete len:113 (+) Transcript_34023:172-510(+)